ncbi:hypothetical protein [Actinokineospora inagensis]|uniref:hypothetical protein n=1 Tax=Actinokineospora inagensis TaxID=103730 RepID=UPI0012FBA92D|nr:hypothetical protein [Actinokineospora inagensis]
MGQIVVVVGGDEVEYFAEQSGHPMVEMSGHFSPMSQMVAADLAVSVLGADTLAG